MSKLKKTAVHCLKACFCQMLLLVWLVIMLLTLLIFCCFQCNMVLLSPSSCLLYITASNFSSCTGNLLLMFFLIFVLRNCLVTLFMPYPYYARPDKLDFVRPECMLANMLVSVEVITTRGYNRFIMLHVVLQATLQQVLTQQWELQKQVDVNASHLEKERHQLAEQIKKVLCYEVCVCLYRAVFGSEYLCVMVLSLHSWI